MRRLTSSVGLVGMVLICAVAVRVSTVDIAADSQLKPQLDATLTPPLLVHVCAETPVSEATVRRASAVAQQLLSAAGVSATWRICHGQEPSLAGADVRPDIVAILLGRRLGRERNECGFASRLTPGVGTALVSVRCVQEFTDRIARLSAYRSHPLLAEGRHDDFVGVLVAHEIGHLLGVRHARKGVMRARLDAEDVIAFRLNRLRFTPEEATRLRAASADARMTIARGRSTDQK